MARWTPKGIGRSAVVDDARHIRLVVAALGVASLVLSGCAPLPTHQVSPGDCLAANGIGYGPFRDGQGPHYTPPIIPRIEQIEEDLRFLSHITKRIRTYKTTDTQSNIPHFAKRFGMRVAQGIELGKDDAANAKQIAVAVQMARDGLVDSLVVGNEVLSSGIVSKPRLLAYLREIRQLLPKDVLVTTAEVWDVWIKNVDLIGAVDFVMAHFYPFWEKQHIDNANRSLWRNYETLQNALRRAHPDRDVRLVIGETGWPTGGAPQGPAVPSPRNQRRFIEEFMASACANSVPFYFFQAFDEEWKWKEGVEGSRVLLPRNRSFIGNWIGSSWGIYGSNGTLKPELAGLFGQPSPGSRLEREILVDGRLAAHYELRSDPANRKGVRLSRSTEALEIAYAAGQRRGVVDIVVGESTSSPLPWKDFSGFAAVSFELRGVRGRETVSVGIKHDADRRDRNGTEVSLVDVGTEFQTYTIPLAQFASPQFPIPDALSRLNVVLQFIFDGAQPRTLYVRNVRYLSSQDGTSARHAAVHANP
jgi:exo-beta-1,3-glucanase (GH17 family)